jgi:hypothetical protein
MKFLFLGALRITERTTTAAAAAATICKSGSTGLDNLTVFGNIYDVKFYCDKS